MKNTDDLNRALNKINRRLNNIESCITNIIFNIEESKKNNPNMTEGQIKEAIHNELFGDIDKIIQDQ